MFWTPCTKQESPSTCGSVASSPTRLNTLVMLFDLARAFKKLIQAVNSPLTLALPKLRLPYEIDTDACKHQIGCALFQVQEDG
eukprot:IDg7267t1